jgi:Domain of unknown function (DUF4082)
MGGWPRALVGVLIGAALGAGSARAASLRASFDPSPDSSADTYLVFSCQGDSTVCTQNSYVSTPDTWTLVDSQPAAVVCASTPCAQTFFVVDPAAGQTEALTITLVAESQAADPAPLLSGPSNVISVTLSGASTSSTSSTTTVPTTSITTAPKTTTTSTTSITTTTVPTVATIWPNTAVPTVAADPDTGAVEIGVKFRSDVNGFITGIRFYKSATNTGTHVGNLWTSTGTKLASATFAGETASGWQQVNFASPVAITANTVYVASYHANVGHYSDDDNYFSGKGVDSPPLHALADGVAGANGVYTYGTSTLFPTQGYISTNYWVDVVFQLGGPAGPTTTTSTSSTLSTTTTSSTSFTTTTTSVTSTTRPRRHRRPPRLRSLLPPGMVCGHPYRSGGGLSVGWDTYTGILCVTGNDPAGYAVVDGHVYAGQPGDPPSFKLALYEGNGASANARQPVGTPVCESDLVTLVPGDNVIPLAGCPVLAPGTSYFILFVAASPDTQIGDLRRRACRRSGSKRTGRHTSAGDSISDPFPDAAAVEWLNDFCQETLWLDLVPAGTDDPGLLPPTDVGYWRHPLDAAP